MRLRRPVARKLAVLAAASAVVAVGAAPPSSAAPDPVEKVPLAVGYGGAVSSVDPDASAAGIEVLRKGGNAVDAAVATAAALGVTEPYSAGIGGGGYFVYYDAGSRTVHTIDGRETAPLSADEGLFLENGTAIPFAEAVTSGLSVGTPGTPATWQTALSSWGSKPLAKLLKPAVKLARHGFTVDATFRAQTASNEARFRNFPATADLFLPGGQLPVVGSTLKNPDLARTYAELGRKGVGVLYRGDLAEDIVDTVNKPPVDPGSGYNARPGDLSAADLAGYRAKRQAPTKASYRGLGVYGMAPSSSGGTTVAEALNILERTDLSKASDVRYLHRYIEASRIAFADRGRWVGDPAFEDVPTKELLSQKFADSRECLIKDDSVLTSPVAPGDPRHPAACGTGGTAAPTTYEGDSTTHLTVADKWGNVVSYTLTIEQTGGSGITVPGRGFLLNNELTDFSFTPANPAVHDPNLPGPGKRPRSSMSPTIVLDRHDQPVVALGSPGGATIITTVLQTLTGFLDRGLPLVDAIAAPRASQRNQTTTELEPGLWNSPLRTELEAIGHGFRQNPEIGAATAVQRLSDGKWLAAAETVRRGGGAAMVVRPVR
ncbi:MULTISPECIES: gamma-glutamyltransferase [Streptomyces]|uniref:Glutathione hydrolase proenzyme n=1 Tax=Streptomyces stelliscabiei TaxID=146820 RepID=A0A8I0PF54_9ACTN|nr:MULTISPECIES: gamma-glutamyltransferase [Streptomyces]KND40242.1 gamma-glutamyltransferase [Streptomyces stelliscabiei]MBE1601215.1 gamma-glutamyltranspeptidase/glutathione hydrolase [Streptomyces stelliscabiei]MDX2517017.1 gamma-glutamyltransferase [Streptomyces stelliscabiei]MDX2554860.1 gamma-glutamyltransferase [Streptomyces stelliscabiei]MDX2610903.1 gamma-glutamyltransferase [Streptomyces stelliscabiei]